MSRFQFARWRCWAATLTRAVGGRRWPKTPTLFAVASRDWALTTLRIARSATLAAASGSRVVIARALAQQAGFLLMDEPNAHLDLVHQLEVYRLARELAAEGQAVLLICHDLLLAPLWVDAAVVMDQGRIVAIGPPSDVLQAGLLHRVFAAKAEITWADGQVSARFDE